MHMKRAFIGLAFVLAMFAAGCGNSAERRVAISGKVLVVGKELPEGSIKFISADPAGKSMSGSVIKNGVFTIPAESGLFAGKYRVEVSAGGNGPPVEEVPGGIKVAKETIPAKYNKNSQLTAEVTKTGPNIFEFKLD